MEGGHTIVTIIPNLTLEKVKFGPKKGISHNLFERPFSTSLFLTLEIYLLYKGLVIIYGDGSTKQDVGSTPTKKRWGGGGGGV